MKFKDKLNSMNCHELFYKSLETSRRATTLAIVNLIICSCYWLLHGYLEFKPEIWAAMKEYGLIEEEGGDQ